VSCPDYGPGCVAAPGFVDASTYTALRNHAAANNRIALLGVAEGSNVASAISTASTYVGEGSGEECVGFFYPWVKIPTTGSLTETIPCEGFVAQSVQRYKILTAHGIHMLESRQRRNTL
jgi:hypothetical protein